MSSIIRRRSGLTVLVPLIGRSFLSEVERPSILRTGLPVAPSLSYRLANRPPGSHPRAAGRSGATSCHGASLPFPDQRGTRALGRTDEFGACFPNGHSWRIPSVPEPTGNDTEG